MRGIEVTDYEPIANIRPGGFTHQRDVHSFGRRKAFLHRDNQTSAIEQGNKTDDERFGCHSLQDESRIVATRRVGYLKSWAAVTTLCATSAKRRFSFIAARRNMP